jgi:parallel beta-helix repeat protein
MIRSESRRLPGTRAWLLVLPALAPCLPAQAATVCVDSESAFLAALDGAHDEDQTINVVAGTYVFDEGVDRLVENDVLIFGGWNPGCASRELDPRMTVFRAPGKRFDVLSFDSIRAESVAFNEVGRVWLQGGFPSGGGNSSLHVERVWFQSLCPNGAPCEDLFEGDAPLILGAEYVFISHAVVADSGGPGCATRIYRYGLSEVSISFSLFSGNASEGLCVGDDGQDPGEDFETFVLNSVFWNNAGDDLVTRESPRVQLRNNIYQSWDANPPSSLASSQNLAVDPQFQDAATFDFRLQPGSPAINTGRIAPYLTPDQDLDGGPRVIGPAPDRGPFESPSTESSFLVTNLLDSTSPVATGSLRWAIQQANATPGLDRIRFALPACPGIISLNALLPDLTDSVFIDGYSQSGSVRNTSERGFNPTLCVAVRDPALTLAHALRIPDSAPDDTLLWVGGVAFGGFDVAAVRLAGGSNSWIFGNQFGGSLGGTALGNNAVNVRLGGTSHENLVGGSEVSQRNLIASAYNGGVEMLDNSSGEEGYGNIVRNNLIGLAANGMDAAPNALGVRVRTDRNAIRDNFISGNLGDAVLVEGPLATGNEIRDNDIGRKTFAFCLPPCTPDYALGNAGAGVRLTGGGNDNRIRYNRIQSNGDTGVRLEDGTGNLLFSNAISANSGLGIDLGTPGVNPVYNTGLAVTGTFANRGINAPALTGASGSGSGGIVAGQLAGRNGVHLVEIFRNASCDGSGRGEGAQPLTAGVVTIGNAPVGGNGSASFEFDLPSGVALDGAILTAVVKDGNDNSSEFSACRAYATVLCREIFRDGLELDPPPPTCTPL